MQATTKPESLFLNHTDSRIPEVRALLTVQNRELIFSYLSKGYVDAIAAHEISIVQFMQDYGLEYRILDEPLQGKDVLIVEDIVDTGRTLHYLMKVLQDRHPASMKLCCMLDKPERRIVDVKSDYVCFNIPDEFVVGFGLDYAQKYRNLPYIGVICQED